MDARDRRSERPQSRVEVQAVLHRLILADPVNKLDVHTGILLDLQPPKQEAASLILLIQWTQTRSGFASFPFVLYNLMSQPSQIEMEQETLENTNTLDTVIGGGNPGLAEAHFQAAREHERNGFRVGAIDELRHAVVQGSNPEHKFHLAYTLDLVGEEEEAVALYEEISFTERPHINALLNLAVIYEDNGQLASAEKCLRQILDTDPNHKRARLYMIDVQSSTEMYYDEEVARDAAKTAAMMNTPVTDFELSVRARNCLKKMDIRTLGDLLKVTEAELLSYKNFGETSLVEIKHMLQARGLRLGQASESGQISKIHQDRYKELLEQAPEQVLKQPVSVLNLSVRARKALQILNIQTLGDLAIRTEAELMGIKNFGSTSLDEINEGLEVHGLELRKID